MKQDKISSMSHTGHVFADLPLSLPEELVETLVLSTHARIDRIVSTGQASPSDFWYDQKEHEWVIVLQGEAELEFDDPADRLVMKPGDYVTIPAHRRHRVVWTLPNIPTVWLAVFFE